jgi:two-component system KDP operon response regulator KdpE
MAEKILIVDDEQGMLQLIDALLTAHGFTTFMAMNGEQALALFHQVAPDLVILDIMMPDISGLDVCREMRRVSPVPILFLTAMDKQEHIVTGLHEGADDYVVKPFHAPELLARVHALLRRARMACPVVGVLRFANGELVINRAEQRVFARDREVALSPLEYNLLLFMAERAGHILPPETLYDAVWGASPDAGVPNVKWYVWRLRQKIESDPAHPRFILTERGKGYRFSPL